MPVRRSAARRAIEPEPIGVTVEQRDPSNSVTVAPVNPAAALQAIYPFCHIGAYNLGRSSRPRSVRQAPDPRGFSPSSTQLFTIVATAKHREKFGTGALRVVLDEPTTADGKELKMSEHNVGPAPVPIPSEPNVHSGGKQEPGGLVPPYEGRQKEGPSQEELAKDLQKQGEGYATGPREVSQAEQEGVSSTDTTGASALGVGESINAQGNEKMLDKSEAAHRADQTDMGIGGHPENVDPESPVTITGR